MISLLVLRRKEPDLERPFKVPFFPVTPIIALIIATIALVAISVYNPILALIYLALMVNPKPLGPRRTMIGAFRVLIRGERSRQGEASLLEAVLDPPGL